MTIQSEIEKWLKDHKAFHCKKCRATITKDQCKRNQADALQGISDFKKFGKNHSGYSAANMYTKVHNEQMLFMCSGCLNGHAKGLQGEAKKALEYLRDQFFNVNKNGGYGNIAMDRAQFIEDHELKGGTMDTPERRASNHAANTSMRTL